MGFQTCLPVGRMDVGLELDRGSFLGSLVGSEFLHRPEAEDAGEEILREGTDLTVIDGDSIVEFVA